MTTLLEQLELMRERMRQMADNEQQLVRGLGEALNVADERLREQVRQFAAEHNQRRAVALEELRSLSAKLGTLPKERFDSVRERAQPLDTDRYIAQGGYQSPPQQQYRAASQSRYEPPMPPPAQTYTPPPPPAYAPPSPPAAAQNPAPTPGDWRHAASRIEEEINLYQNNLRARGR